MNKISMIANALANDENSTDAELAQYLTEATGLPFETIKKIVTYERPKFLENVMVSSEEAIGKWL